MTALLEYILSFDNYLHGKAIMQYQPCKPNGFYCCAFSSFISRPAPIMLEILLLFFPEFPKNFSHYSFDHYS